MKMSITTSITVTTTTTTTATATAAAAAAATTTTPTTNISSVMNFNNETFITLYADDRDTCVIDEPENVQFYRFITNGLLLNLIGILGILGNVISMIILSRPQMRSSINYLLIGLARIDTMLIITSILLFGLPGIYPYSGLLFTYYYVVYPHIAPIVFPLAMVVQTASVYLTLTVSLERFVAVCHPLRARSLCTYGRARIYVIVIIIFSTLYNLPKLWETRIKEETLIENNITIYCPRPSPFRENELYKTIYIHWLYLIFLYLLPFMGLAILNAAIYRQVRKANQERQRLSRLQKREIGLATMLLCVVAVFFICNLLPLVLNIIDTFTIIRLKDQFSIMVNTSNLLVTINSSVNFIIYVIFGEKFKRLFLVLFCHNSIFGTGRESPDGATHDDSFMSNGDRQSIRLHRHNTSISRNGMSSNRLNGNNSNSNHNSNNSSSNNNSSTRQKKSSRSRAASPGPCVYYPANRSNKEISTYTTQTSILGPD